MAEFSEWPSAFQYSGFLTSVTDLLCFHESTMYGPVPTGLSAKALRPTFLA